METRFNISEDYTRIVSIRKYADPDKFEFAIKSEWAGAKHPKEQHTTFTWVTDAAELRKLQVAISNALREELAPATLMQSLNHNVEPKDTWSEP